MLYTVQATIRRVIEDRGVEWNSTTYTPQFILDGNILGITSPEAAIDIAAGMFVKLGFPREDVDVHLLRIEKNVIAI